MIKAKTKLKAATSRSAIGIAALLMVPGRALAANECGTVNTAADPQTATCTGAFAPYPTGITYDESTLASPSQGNVVINIAGTTIVNAATDGVTVRGAGNFNAGTSIFTGASVNSTNDAVVVQARGSGTASILNSGAITANRVGLLAFTPIGIGTATVTNAIGGIILSSGNNAEAGIEVSGASASIFNNGSVTVNGAASSNNIAGLSLTTSSVTGVAYGLNTGSVTVAGNTGVTVGIGGSYYKSGATTLANTGTLSVTGGSGDTFGFNILGGSGGAIFNNQGGPLLATTTVTGTGNITAAAATQMEGTVAVDFQGVPITINATGGFGRGILANGNAGATVNVTNQVIGNTTYNGAMSIYGTGATGIEVSAAGGPIGVTLTNAPLTVDGRDGVANGILIAGTYVPVIRGPIQFGQQADPAVTVTSSDMVVTGSSATGVTINGAGPNSATFTGSSLTVLAKGGFLNKSTGFDLEGGTDTFVTMTPTSTRGAALSVNGGFFNRGAYLQGTGNLTATFGDTITVSGGLADGVDLQDGATQTVTLGKSLTVSGSGGRGIALMGLNDGGNSTGMTVHAPVAITYNGDTGTSGGATAIYADNSAGLTIDGAPSITVSSTGTAIGVDASTNITGPITATLGSVTVTSSSKTADVYGVNLSAAGPITLADAGTITVTGAGSGANYGIRAVSRVAESGSAINLTLNNVIVNGTAAQNVGYGILAGNSGSGADTTNVTVQQVTTSGVGGYGVVGNGSSSGASVINIGSLVAGTNTGGVSTSGINADAVIFATFDGPSTINNIGLVATSGASAYGIKAFADGDGSVAVNNWRATTTGTNSEAIDVLTRIGTATVNSTTATTTGADAIHVETRGGNAVINLLDGGTTSSGTSNGVFVHSFGSSTVNLGASANTASVYGGLWGINSTATFGTTLANRGSLTGLGGAALRLRGGTDLVSNSGVINGYVDISTIAPPVVIDETNGSLTEVSVASTGMMTPGSRLVAGSLATLTLLPPSITFNDTGAWNLFGGTSTFDTLGTNVLTNSGTMNVAPNSTTATTINVLAPDTRLTFNNSGLIGLQQGAGGTAHTGDVLVFSSATYTGSGNAQLAVDANLGNAAIGVSPLQTADRLVISTGSVAGSTTLVVRDLGASLTGQFNTVGIPVVQSPGSTPAAFTLQNNVIHKGYVDYQLTQSGGNYFLVGLPSQTAFEIVRTGAEAQEFWRRTGDAWADEMRSPHFDDKHGLTLWGHGIYADGTSKSGPTYSVTAINQFGFNPDLEIKNTFYGGLFGLDYSWGKFAVGLLGGYGDQKGRFKIDDNQLNLKGFTFGGYARYQEGGFFIDGLFKYDGYKVDQIVKVPSFRIPFDGSTYGAELQVGYHYVTNSIFLEPVAALSWTRSRLDSFNSAAAGVVVDFSHARSLYGTAGLRLGTTLPSSDWTVTPFIGAYAQGDLDRRNRATIAAGPTAFTFEDAHSRASARGEIGIVGKAISGLELSANLDGVTGGDQRDISARVGIAFHW